ncbi:MAG: hypothetical protein QOG48_2067 [Verrucomicrobiota bacterium]
MKGKIDKYIWWTIFVVVAVTVIAIRVRLLGIPLERDEGEYAYSGQLMRQGIPPYQLAYNMKFPGTYAAYALIMSIFGQSAIGIHLGLLLINAATVALIFFLGRRLLGQIGGIAAAATYAITSVSPTVLGFAGHATHFVVFFAIAGALLLLIGQDRQSCWRLFASGILFGAAVLMKQPGVFFPLFAVGYLIFSRAKTKQVATFLGGAVLPFVLTCAILWRAGVFEKFWFWSITYARQYGTRISFPLPPAIVGDALPSITGSNVGFWMLALVGLAVCAWRIRSGRRELFLCGFFVFSALAVCAGLYFRPHYFILALPAVALLIGDRAAAVTKIVSRIVIMAAFVFATALALFAERDFFFSLNMNDASRLTSGVNPFPESMRVGDFLREHTTPDDTIAVLGSEPQIYFYAQRHSATGYIYTYGLMEPQPFAAQMQKEMMREIETARPKYVVFVAVDTSWLMTPQSDRTILKWFENYSAAELKPAGLVNIVSENHTDYYLPYTGETVTPSPMRITIFERKP